jgi:hypothetical protein
MHDVRSELLRGTALCTGMSTWRGAPCTANLYIADLARGIILKLSIAATGQLSAVTPLCAKKELFVQVIFRSYSSRFGC